MHSPSSSTFSSISMNALPPSPDAKDSGQARPKEAAEDDDDTGPPRSKLQQWWHGSHARQLWKAYGAVAIATYGGVYVGTLGCIYAALSTPYLGSSDAVTFLHSTGIDQWVDVSSLNPKTGNFMAAWILTKFTEPLRFGVTLWVTPRVARMLGMPPPPPSPRATRRAEAAAAAAAVAAEEEKEKSAGAGRDGGRKHKDE